MAGVDFARLGYAVDTAGLERAKAAQDALTASGVRLGQTADQAAVRLSQMGQAGVGGLRAAAGDVNSATMELQRAQAAFVKVKAEFDRLRPANFDAMTLKEKLRFTRSVPGYDAASDDLVKAQVVMQKFTAAQKDSASASEEAAGKFAFLGAAAGSLTGIIGFQLLGQVTSLVSRLLELPVASAKAEDGFRMLEARMKYTFNGSSTAAKQAYDDILRISREVGAPINDIAGNYTMLATSGRAAGMSRGQASNITEAFQLLGQLSGADPGSVARAQYQFSQAVSLNRMSYSQDYRYMEQALPAIGPALAKSMDLDYGQFVRRMQSGEITGSQLSDAMSTMVDQLRQALGEVPNTLERSQARLETEWTKLMTDMGVSFKSSEFFQSLSRGWTDFLHNVDTQAFGTPQQKIAGLQSAAKNTIDPVERQQFLNEIARLQKQMRSPAGGARIGGDLGAAAGQAYADAETSRQAKITQALGTSDQLMSSIASRRYLQGLIDQNSTALGMNPTPEQAADLRKNIAAATAQLIQMGSVLERLSRQSRNANADLATYGAGAGFDMARQARGLVDQSAAQGEPISMAQAMAMLRGQRITDAKNQVGVTSADLDLQQRLLLPSAGGTPQERRRAQIAYQSAQFAAQCGGADAASAGVVGANRANLDRAASIDNATQLAERRAADDERLRSMKAQITLGLQMGDIGRIATAQFQRQEELRRAGLDLTKQELAAELARVAENEKIAIALEHQNEAFGYLVDAAHTAASTIGDLFHGAIADAFDKGRISGETALRLLERAAIRVADDIADAFLLKPLERQAENWLGGKITSVLGKKGSDKAVDELGAAAEDAAAKIGQDLSQSAAQGAAKIILGTTAAQTETAARAQGILAIQAMTVAAAAAAKALTAVAAASGADAAGSATTSALSAFGSSLFGGKATSTPSIQPTELINLANGGVFARPRLIPLANGDVIQHSEAGEEAVLPLARDGAGRLGVRAPGGGGGGAVVQIYDQRGGQGAAPVDVQTQRGPDGVEQVRVFIRDQVKSGIRNGDFNKPMAQQFGAAPVIKRA